MRSFIAQAVIAASLLTASLAGFAQTTDIAGTKFPNTVQVGNAKLQLNGAGVRYKVVFKVYAAALYTTDKLSTPEAVLASTAPRRMHIVMLREIDANELGRLFTKGMEQNAPREEFLRSIAGVMRMSEMFSAYKKLQAGETLTVDWQPGVGTTVFVNGKQQGAPIKEPEFNSLLMRIWLGKEPADAQLKEALLGRAPASPGGGAYN